MSRGIFGVFQRSRDTSWRFTFLYIRNKSYLPIFHASKAYGNLWEKGKSVWDKVRTSLLFSFSPQVFGRHGQWWSGIVFADILHWSLICLLEISKISFWSWNVRVESPKLRPVLAKWGDRRNYPPGRTK